MIKPIIKDVLFLERKSQLATLEDIGVATDLLDTLKANAQTCVGMAANMIGVTKQIIAFQNDKEYMVMINPKIIKYSGAFETEESCLSLTGKRKTKRYKYIKVEYQNLNFQMRIKTFTNWTAQIIQHEIDHCNGIII
ncbi:MAG TPA: peptide deformylase [Clostridiales bacterium]|nr:peptide deformylase [Clostridiales bacterium]